VDGWIDLIEDVLEDTETKKSELFDPFEHKLVKKLLPDYLQEIDDCRIEIARLEAEKESFEQQSDDENEEPEGQEENEQEKPNYAKALQERVKELKRLLKEDKGNGALAAEIKSIEEKLAPYKEMMESLKAEKKRLKALSKSLLQVLKKRRQGLSADDRRSLVLDLTRADLEVVLKRYIEEHLQEVGAAAENLWDKYGASLRRIQAKRDDAAQGLDAFLQELNYVC
jgi:type I restriction enzyme M protein